MPEIDVNLSVKKTAALLRCFSQQHPEWSGADLTRETGIQRSIVYRLLATLEQENFLERSDSGNYRVGPAVFALAAGAVASVDLRDEVSAYLVRLSRATRDTAFFFVESNLSALIFDLRLGGYPVQGVGPGIGGTIPLHCGAGPFALLANLDDPKIERVLKSRLERFTKNTIVDPHLIRQRIAAVRDQGYVISEEDFVEHIVSVGAPIFAPGGMVRGAISVTGLKARYNHEQLTELALSLREAAQTISARIGFVQESSDGPQHQAS